MKFRIYIYLKVDLTVAGEKSVVQTFKRFSLYFSFSFRRQNFARNFR